MSVASGVLSATQRWGRVTTTSCRSESSNISLVVLDPDLAYNINADQDPVRIGIWIGVQALLKQNHGTFIYKEM